MRLRNKKTGEVQTCDFAVISDDSRRDGELLKLESHIFIFRSIEKLNEEYGDYKPAEPLIKDEKIRKVVRAWAEANNVLEVFAGRVGDGTYMTLLELYDEDDERRRISVPSAFSPAGMKAGEAYTIAELCGEEEE